MRLPARSLVLFGLFTAIGLLFTSSGYFDDLARGHTGTLETRFIEEMTGAYAALAVLPIAWLIVRRLPWATTPWLLIAIGHLAGAVVFSGAHTTLMALSRTAIYWALGLGRYDYGTMIFRYPMELSKDFIVYGVALAAIYIESRLRAEQQATLEAAELRAELVETRLANLRLQLHPHFLFNSLNAISSVMYDDPQAADRMVTRLSDYLRLTLEASDRQEMTVADELRMTESYTDVMRARFERQLHLSIACEPGAERALVPSMLLQPLVENAILHGGVARDRALAIEIDVRREGGGLAIEVRDTGVGFPLNGDRRDGRGLGATRSRLAQRYGARAHLETANRAEGGACVRLHVPLPAPAAV